MPFLALALALASLYEMGWDSYLLIVFWVLLLGYLCLALAAHVNRTTAIGDGKVGIEQ